MRITCFGFVIRHLILIVCFWLCAFYAELLLDMGNISEARKHADFVLNTPVAEEDAREFAEYTDIALQVVRKSGGSAIKLGNGRF